MQIVLEKLHELDETSVVVLKEVIHTIIGDTGATN